MALKLQKQTLTGLVIDNAYCKVESIVIVGKSAMQFSVFSFAGDPSVVQSFEVNGYSCDYDLNGENPIKQAYIYLKTLPEFENAQDC